MTRAQKLKLAKADRQRDYHLAKLQKARRTPGAEIAVAHSLGQFNHAEKRIATLRKEIADSRPLRLRALDEAQKLVGVMEHGGNNQGEVVSAIIRANGGTGPEPWCGDFDAYVYRKAGSKAVQRGWAATRLLGHLAGLKIVSEADALPGDIVVYDFNGDGQAKHTGILKKKILVLGKIRAIEGNTGATGAVSDSTTGGDGVYEKDRPTSQVLCYVRVLR